MKVIHFNHTTVRPPSYYPRGLLYLSTFSFILSFFLSWLMARQLLCGTSALEDSENRRRYLYILVEWEQAISNSTLSSLTVWNNITLPAIKLCVCFFPLSDRNNVFSTCILGLSVFAGGVRKRLNVLLISRHSFASFLIGLLHLVRSTNCLLGMLQLNDIKPNKCIRDSLLGVLPCQGLID